MKRKYLTLTFLFLTVLVSAQTLPSNTVTIFYSTTCPICQKMTLTLRELKSNFENRGIEFQLVFPSDYDTPGRIGRFLKTYKLKIKYISDYDKHLARKMNATVTPQAILTDSVGQILYSGKIDNWFEDIGKRRTVITEHYLQGALNSYLKGEDIKIKKTEPVGCFIF
jgi:thiol-disulfide isomerase/thioredoxin